MKPPLRAFAVDRHNSGGGQGPALPNSKAAEPARGITGYAASHVEDASNPGQAFVPSKACQGAEALAFRLVIAFSGEGGALGSPIGHGRRRLHLQGGALKGLRPDDGSGVAQASPCTSPLGVRFLSRITLPGSPKSSCPGRLAGRLSGGQGSVAPGLPSPLPLSRSWCRATIFLPG